MLSVSTLADELKTLLRSYVKIKKGDKNGP